MTNKDFAIAVNKFFYYTYNYAVERFDYPTLFDGMAHEYLPTFFKAFDLDELHHLVPIWNRYLERYGRSGAIMEFYSDIDNTHRAKMLQYINTYYTLSESFGINLSEINDL